MADKKQGCSVRLSLIVTDEEGKEISDAGSVWYGFDRPGANAFSQDLFMASALGAAELTDQINKDIYGDKYRENYRKPATAKK